MTGDCHVRFCESRGAQSPQPLTKAHKKHHEAKHKRAANVRHERNKQHRAKRSVHP